MTYSVKEIFYTLQGEGMNVGRPAVFCRFTGCNLWTGREQHRDRAICQFCDTEFVGTDGIGGGKFKQAQDLAHAVGTTWDAVSSSRQHAFVVCTGGEPLLQLNNILIDALHGEGFEIAVETNGTQNAPANIDWLCVSPKARAPLRQLQGHELKLIFPQPGAEPERFESLAFEHFFLQPMDGPLREENTKSAIDYCSKHPRWRLSIQMHKLIGIP
jgi:7-carboxy-7-deazaguanine synthase